LGLYAADGLKRLQALAANADSIPITRLWLAFASPNLVYVPGSKTLKGTDLAGFPTTSADGGFADVAAAAKKLEASGVEVFVSMGGWNFNCFPYFYTRYSVGGYGTHTPNYWKVQKYGGGSLDGCTPENQYCYTCEPPSEKTTLDSFAIFPEPANSSTWKAAQKFVEASAGSPAVEWHSEWVPGQTVTDSKTGTAVKVPGSDAFVQQGRDPYEDLVFLAMDLGISGVDVDYEEFWHADTWKTNGTGGSYELHQTVYKYAAIVKDVKDAITTHAPKMKLSTASGAVGAWSGKWWGGNMKGLWLKVNQKYPELISFMSTGANAGGINVMTYDLSSNPEFHECPSDSVCALDKQVDFYMGTYKTAGIAANVGYEIGIPAYPGETHDPTHQLYLTTTLLATIAANTQAHVAGGFFWAMYKPASGTQASATLVAQAICDKVLPGNKRCKGTIPEPSEASTMDGEFLGDVFDNVPPVATMAENIRQWASARLLV